ncbi:YncE family protein [Streptomyces nigra]|uniref:YncE family protein n=1 Tax=Streptomyces nigra TaxID=1827580 RepID=UPI00380E4EE8
MSRWPLPAARCTSPRTGGSWSVSPPTGAGGAPLDGRLTVLAADGLAPLAGAPVGQVPIMIRTTPDGARAFVAGLRSGTVHVVNPADGCVITVLDVDPGDPDTTQGAHGIAYLP